MIKIYIKMILILLCQIINVGRVARTKINFYLFIAEMERTTHPGVNTSNLAVVYL